jgi:hypothetical protein
MVTDQSMGDYPREDKCRHCGAHIGYILHPMGEFAALGCCDKLECRKKEMEAKDVGD